MTEFGPILGAATDYAALHALLRKRQADLGLSFLTLNHLSGLSYVDKVLCPQPMDGDVAANGRRTSRGIGPASLGPLLGALGLVILIAEDPQQTERMRTRWVKRCEHNVVAWRPSMDELLNQRIQRRLSENGRKGAQSRHDRLTPEQRTAIARKAARIRWNIERAEGRAEGAAAT